MLRRSWAFLMVAALAVTACEGPEGPAGPAGPAGPEGPQGATGPAGADGADANETCTDCHTGDVVLFAKQQQLITAAHGPGMYIRDSGECAVCHTHQGFLERLDTGEWGYSAGSVDDVAAMNCRTCHMIHTTYTAADYGLTAEGIPVEFRAAATIAGEAVSVDFGNTANLCASCHQSRIRSPMPMPGEAAQEFTSTHYGPHHGTQGDMNAAVGYYWGGDKEGVLMAHQTSTDGCATCHMAEGSLYYGGHTFEMGSNYDVCAACHSSGGDSFDLFSIQTNTEAKLATLAGLLDDQTGAGVMHWDTEDMEWHPVPGTYSGDVLAAFWNFMGVIEDGSMGVHNPGYITEILDAAIAALTP